MRLVEQALSPADDHLLPLCVVKSRPKVCLYLNRRERRGNQCTIRWMRVK